ncbi:helix-turn-helix domain containing protein [Devosia rhodophyticola]|uniref:Helix-turn-helix domain containing protein n=1 Tax=Devosia rhodophyticola TaxID=3026423 RepID=A0ABY7YZY3_9HYPH|nr:TetR/AcrR family transcriptional regulator [Devosia rhodophyticola]WDR06938.1 helix-turn-helix domain containing protein [Devosia rhodophyticola]
MTNALLRRFMIEDDKVDARERKRRTILVAAAKLFVRFGYRKTSIDDVARDANVAKGTIYLYFATKPELLLHTVVAEKAPLVATFLDVMEVAEPRERLWRYLFETARAFPRMPLTTQFTVPGNDLEPAVAELGPDIAAALTEHRTEALVHLVRPFAARDYAGQQDIKARAAALLGLIYAMPAALEKSMAIGLSADRAAEVYADMLVGGFAAEPSSAAKITRGRA